MSVLRRDSRKFAFTAAAVLLVAALAACGGGASGGGPPATTPPTAPTNLMTTAVSSTQIDLSWTASTDNVGVTGYLVERCQGAGCSNFAQITTPAGTSFNDAGLTPSTSYSYRVRATDAAGNLSGYSNVATASTQAEPEAAPTVSSVSPNKGPLAGGTAVTIMGTNFAAGATVTFGGAAATNVVVVSGTQITATTPAGSAGAVTVTATVNGQSGSLASGFTYAASQGEVTLVQHVSGSNTRANTLGSPYCYYQILPNPTTAGDAVIVGFTFNGQSTLTVTDDKSDSYTVEQNFFGTTSAQSIGLAAAFNVAPGARVISVCFPSSPGGGGGAHLAVMASEFTNVVGIDGSGTGVNSNGTTVTAGNLTPSAANDLIYQITFSTSISQSSFAAGSQSNIAWNLLSADLQDGLAAQYGEYSSVGALNPTMSMGTSNGFVSAAVLFETGTAGSIPTGMRIVHLQHESICGVATCGSSFPNPVSLQFPSTGNLMVALSGGGNPICTMSSMTDSSSNSWVQAGSTYSASSGGQDTVQIFYAGNAIASTSLGLTVNFSAKTCDWSILLYDVANAAASPLDTTNGSTGNQGSTSGTFTVPYTIIPAESGELIFTNIIWDFNTATGLTSNVGNSYSDANMFSGELISGPEPVDQNNGWGHAISTSTSAITFTWDQANDTTLAAGPWASMAAAFKAASPP
jgi:chitodextrinase